MIRQYSLGALLADAVQNLIQKGELRILGKPKKKQTTVKLITMAELATGYPSF